MLLKLALIKILVFVNLQIMMGVLNPMYPSCPDQTLQLIMFCIIMVDINKPCAKCALIIIMQIKVQPPFFEWIKKEKEQVADKL